MPEVSIIIPTFNRKKLLRETLDSVIAQTFKDWEAIVVDDGSTDGTDEIMNVVSEREIRVRYVKRKEVPKGACKCRNIGVQEARGKYVLFLDSDDLLKPRCLERRTAALKTDESLDFVVFPCELFKKTTGDLRILWNIETGEDDLDRFLAFDGPWVTASVLWRKKGLAATGPWNERLSGWQDCEFFIRALTRENNRKKFLNEAPDVFYRAESEDSISSKIDSKEAALNRILWASEIEKSVIESQMLNAKRRLLLTGIWFRTARGLASHGFLTKALHCWLLCYGKSMISISQLIEGWVLYFLSWGPKRSYWFGEYLKKRWPAEIVGRTDKTHKKVGLDMRNETTEQGSL